MFRSTRSAILRMSLAFASLSLFSMGCSSRKAEAAPRRANTSEAKVTLEALGQSYADQDMERVLSHFEDRFYPDISRLRRALYEDREKITQVRLEFHVNQEIASESGSVLTVRWNRGWTDIATGTAQIARGTAEFQFDLEGKVLDIRPSRGGMPIGFN